jgi:hypothetical protein
MLLYFHRDNGQICGGCDKPRAMGIMGGPLRCQPETVATPTRIGDIRAGHWTLKTNETATSTHLATNLHPTNSGPRPPTPLQGRPRSTQPNTPHPPCPHIVTPQPHARTHRDPTKRQSSSFPPMRKRNPSRYLNALQENPDARDQKAKYSKYWTTHPSSLKRRIRRTCGDDAAISSRHVLPRCSHELPNNLALS